MVTLLQRKTSRRRSRRKAEQTRSVQDGNGALGYDFALLGLKARESRVDVIRRAAKETAAKIQQLASNDIEHDKMLSDLATSTYRLLDPRKRHKPLERIQLCIFGEEELETQKRSKVALLKPLVVAELVSKMDAKL